MYLNVLLIVIFENFVKSMTSCSLKLKVTPSFCFAFKIPDDPTATNNYGFNSSTFSLISCITKMKNMRALFSCVLTYRTHAADCIFLLHFFISVALRCRF